MRRSILLVDDDQKTRLLLKTYLEKQQYEVHAAHDGHSFLSAFEIFKAELSLVILDVMLPDTDGFTLCKTVRQARHQRGIAGGKRRPGVARARV